jgi:hypothetical protein
MSLDKATMNLKFDSRLTEYNLRAGNVSKEELSKRLSELPDLADKCEKINLEEKGNDSNGGGESH